MTPPNMTEQPSTERQNLIRLIHAAMREGEWVGQGYVGDFPKVIAPILSVFDAVTRDRDALMVSARDVVAAWDEQEGEARVSIRVTMALDALRRAAEKQGKHCDLSHGV